MKSCLTSSKFIVTQIEIVGACLNIKTKVRKYENHQWGNLLFSDAHGIGILYYVCASTHRHSHVHTNTHAHEHKFTDGMTVCISFTQSTRNAAK